jgi:3-isopropylmalate/(R)-2-methylmalate dehydratase small subunit
MAAGGEGGGRAWVFGDDINTDVIAPGRYLKGAVEELARHALEDVTPEFAAEVQPGDVVVAGANFGIGSSREQAPQALKMLGVGAVLARSFARIFYRNAINLGLTALICDEVARISAGDSLRVDARAGAVENLSTGETYACEAMPPHLIEIIEDGGLLAHLEKRLGGGAR